MQQFIRTVNTTDAFKMKLEQLEKEYKLKLELLQKEIKLKENELSQYKDVGVGGELGSGFLRFLSWVAFVLGGLLFIIILIGVAVDSTENNQEALPFIIGLLILSTFLLILGALWRSKSKAMLTKALKKQQKAEEKRKPIETVINRLREEMKRLEEIYQKEMVTQQNIYQQHMLNQQELIQNEVETINQVSTQTSETKECPQCAEIVRAKAKICRFCNYQFG